MIKTTGEMPFLDHLEELRSRILKSLAAIVIGVGIGLWAVLKLGVLEWLKLPIAAYVPNGKLTVTAVTEPFMITLKLGAVVGLVLASPIILYQLWAFLSPALYERERKTMIPSLLVGLGLFLLGAWVGWEFVVPKAIPIMLGFQAGSFNQLITYDSYFSFVLQIMLAFGISAEVPLVMIMLSAIGLVEARRWNKFRRFAIVLSFVAGALLSPGGDAFLMMLVTVPLILLYELGVAGALLAQRARRRPAASRDDDDPPPPAAPTGGGGSLVASLLLLVLVGGLATAPLAAQDRPPPRTGGLSGVLGGGRDSLGRGIQPAKQMDSATAKRLGLPTKPSRTFPGPDSVMAALLARPGFAMTRYLGDSAVLVADSQRIILSGHAATSRDSAVMEAGRIVYDDHRCELLASGEPRLFDDQKIAIGRVLKFDTCNDRGVFTEAFTTFDELGDNWFVRGNLAVDSSASRLFASGGEFTSCDLPLPHYQFKAGEVKWVSQSYLVARPAVLYVRDVPIAWLPFLFQDTKPGRRSGILVPQFGFNDIVRPTRGYNRQVTNIGYYWAPNDYLGATFRFDWFSSRYIQYGGQFDYSWRNRFLNGALAVNRQVEVGGSSSTQLQWNHSQEFNITTRLQLSANYVTDSRVLSGNAVDPILSTQQISSSANFTKRFRWGNVTIGGTRRQNVSDGSGQMTLPSLTVTPSPIALGGSVSWAPTMSATNDLQFKRPLATELVVGGGTIDSLTATGSARSSSLRFDTPFTFGRFTWRNQVTYQDQQQSGRTVTTSRVPDLSTADPNDSTTTFTVTGGTFQSGLNWDTGINLPQLFRGSWKLQPTVSIVNSTNGPFRLRNNRTDGRWVQQSKRVEFGLSARPDFYGFLNTAIGPYAGFRHQVTPSFTFQLSPEAQVPEEYAAALGGRSTGAKAPSRKELRIGLTQNFQAKPRPAPGDTTTDPRNVPKVTLLSITTSPIGYDFEQAKLPGRTGWTTQAITNSLQSDLVQGFTLSLTHDLWEGTVGSDTARFNPFLQSVSANFTMTGRTIGSLLSLVGLGSAPDPNRRPDTTTTRFSAGTDRRFRPGSFATASPLMQPRVRGFSAGITYSLSRQRTPGAVPQPTTTPGPGEFNNDPFGGLPLVTPTFQGARSNIGLNMSFAPTTFWSVTWNTQYNITDGRFESHQIQLTRDLHDWRAAFNFSRNANGNFALYFNIQLISLPDLKFDYNQTTLQP